MKKKFFNLAFICLLLTSVNVFSQIIDLNNETSHLRMSIKTSRDLVQIKKIKDKIYIKSLDLNFINELSEEVSKINFPKDYIKEVKTRKDEGPPFIEMTLLGPYVEMFSFYMKEQEAQVVDFWKDEVAKDLELPQEKKIIKTVAKTVKKIKRQVASTVSEEKKIEKEKIVSIEENDEKIVRDFRYGAAFVWNGEPLVPEIFLHRSIGAKSPDYFYPIKDRNVKSSEIEAHLQLSINLYKEKKWGLMYKSIKLFYEKYGNDKFTTINEYLKINSTIKENINKKNSAPFRTALNMLENITISMEDYNFKKASLKYLLSYFYDHKNYLKVLSISKKLFVEAKNNFDYEEIPLSVEYMLNSLANLGQIEKIIEISKDKTILKLVPEKTTLSYLIYTFLKRGEIKKVKEIYEEKKKGIAQYDIPSILHNVGESYFRLGEYDHAIKVYDEYLANFSHHLKADLARLKLAISYDLLDNNFEKTLYLYKEVINKTQDELINYEAKIRYVALRTIRKKKTNAEDLETRVFLDKHNIKDIKKHINLKKILWLVRLRSFIVDKNYKDALSFLTAIPFDSLKNEEKRVFEGDGAEIIYGLIKNLYNKNKFSEVIKVWEIYKDKYINKVAKEPSLNYIVAKSYLSLKLFDGVERVVKRMVSLREIPDLTYPIWVERVGNNDSESLIMAIEFLKNLGLKNFDQADKKLSEIKKVYPSFSKIKFYESKLLFNESRNIDAIKSLEEYLAKDYKIESYDEVSDIMLIYLESLHKIGNRKKYIKVAEALLKDSETSHNKNQILDSLRERFQYLLIEKYSEGNLADKLLALNQIKKFMKSFPESKYSSRVKYIWGKNLIASSETDKGKNILKDLLGNKETSETLKNLIKSELSLASLKGKML